MLEKGIVYRDSRYSTEKYPYTLNFVEESKKHLLRSDGCGDITNLKNIPIRLIHGMKDEDIPYEFSIEMS
jgi:hypothetical protein